MEINVAGRTLNLYNQINVNLKFDSLSDKFDGAFYFNPTSAADRAVFKPGTYQPCTITHGGVLVITGTVLTANFASAGDPPKQLCYISGYSKTGVLEDCVCVNMPLPNDGLSLEMIAYSVSKHYGIKRVVDPEVKEVCDTIIARTCPEKDQKISDYLDTLFSHFAVALSHTPEGDLLLTRVKAGKKLTKKETIVNLGNTQPSVRNPDPSIVTQTRITTVETDRAVLYNFVDGDAKWFSMNLAFDGSKLHSDILVEGQDKNGNAISSDLLWNPYFDNSTVLAVNKYNRDNQAGIESRGARPITHIQKIDTETNEDDTARLTVRQYLGCELRDAIVLTIRMQGWTLNGNLVTPNQIITVTSPENYLFKATKFFIQEVHLYGDEKEENATLTCVLPECFNIDLVKNVFNA